MSTHASNRAEGAADDKIAIPIQPKAIDGRITHVWCYDKCVSSVVRQFNPADILWCRYCPAGMCTAMANGVCVQSVPDYIPDHLAATFSLADWYAAHPEFVIDDDRAAHQSGG